MIRLISALVFTVIFSQLSPMAPKAHAVTKQSGCGPQLRSRYSLDDRNDPEFLDRSRRDIYSEYENLEVSIFSESNDHAAFDDQSSGESRDHSPAF